MAFFRKWKTHYKHKKFTSVDDVIDGDDWKLNKKSLKGLKSDQSDDIKFNLDNGAIDYDKSKLNDHLTSLNHHKHLYNINDDNDINNDNDNDNDDDDDIDKPIFKSYDIKYLGCTPIETKRSEKVTAEAIKTVIANAKAGGRKLKSQKRVKLNVTQDGLDILDYATKETLMRFSIYKISYCSVDAAHDHAFSFVGSEPDPLSDKEKMSCHVFLCPKRKIAHEITLLVARCFENAYQNWRDTVMQQQQQQQQKEQDQQQPLMNGHIVPDNKNSKQEGNILIKSKVEVHKMPTVLKAEQSSPLIDLVSNDSTDNHNNNTNEDIRKYFQNSSWVLFDDESKEQSQEQQRKDLPIKISAY